MSRIRSTATALAGVLALAAFAWAQQEQTPEKITAPKQDVGDPQKQTIESSKQFIEKYDRNKDGYLQRAELPAEMRDAFDALDLDKDGKLSAAELERHARFMERRHPRHRQPAEMITIWILEQREPRVSLAQLQQVYDLLRKLDRTGDGKLTPEDFELAHYAATQARLKMMLERCDRDKDGRISKDEAMEHVGQRFDEFDANHDGFLDKSELEQALKHHNRPAAGPRDNDAKESFKQPQEQSKEEPKPVDRQSEQK